MRCDNSRKSGGDNTLTLSPCNPSGPVGTPRHLRWAVLATLGICAFLYVWMLGAEPTIGDEAYHFRRATVHAKVPWPGLRTTHDPIYPDSEQCAIRYWDASGWHIVLAQVFRGMGRPSFQAAQAYQALFAFALGLFAYLAGRELYGNAGGWWAWALTMTMPINMVFSMLLYMEVPVAAATAAAVYSLLRRKPLGFGLALAAMFYLKMATAMMLTPLLILAAFAKIGDTWRQRAQRTGLALAVALLVLMPDFVWRTEHFGSPILLRDSFAVFQTPLRMAAMVPMKQVAIPQNLFDPEVAPMNFGIPGLVALLVTLVWAVVGLVRTAVGVLQSARSAGLRETLRSLGDRIPANIAVAAVPLVIYTTAYLILLQGAYDARYLHPTLLFVALLGGGLLARAKPLAYKGRRRWWVRAGLAAMFLAMIAQVASVPPYVRGRRLLPASVAAGFEWIKANVASGDRILYPEFNLATITERPILWAAIHPRYLFTVPEPEQVRILHFRDVRYIAIHPTRFVERADPAVEPIGVPVPWARSLRTLPYMTQVYPEQACEIGAPNFIVYRIEYDKVPSDWLTKTLPEAPVSGGNRQ